MGMQEDGADSPMAGEGEPVVDALHGQWRALMRAAEANMRERAESAGALIEVAAQHPLVDGWLPNAEFTARLDEAVRLYGRLREGGGDVRIYVPGSLHMLGGVSDGRSLSAAGCEYLAERGVPRDALLGDDANQEFKGDAGVYNSSDECYVASRLFERLGYGSLHCICSPAQLMRKALSYVAFGFLPHMHSVPCDRMFHDYVEEAFLYVPRLLADGTGLQGESEEADRLRGLRKPRERGEDGEDGREGD